VTLYRLIVNAWVVVGVPALSAAEAKARIAKLVEDRDGDPITLTLPGFVNSQLHFDAEGRTIISEVLPLPKSP
jgi:hypothetical protein